MKHCLRAFCAKGPRKNDAMKPAKMTNRLDRIYSDKKNKVLKNLSEDFKVCFEDQPKMRLPEWIATPFDFNVQNVDINSQLQGELIDMCVDLEA